MVLWGRGGLHFYMYAYRISLMLFHLFVLSFIERGVLNFEAMIIGPFVSSSLSIFIFSHAGMLGDCVYIYFIVLKWLFYQI